MSYIVKFKMAQLTFEQTQTFVDFNAAAIFAKSLASSTSKFEYIQLQHLTETGSPCWHVSFKYEGDQSCTTTM